MFNSYILDLNEEKKVFPYLVKKINFTISLP